MATCKEEALRWVHLYAVGGAVFAALPLPVSTTAGLATLEAHLIKMIGDIYGSPPSPRAITSAAAGLALAGRGLRRISRGADGKRGILRLAIRMGIAAAAIEIVGRVAVNHYERKSPHRTFHPTAYG
jgi:uncharacterized protein (DUF697 family)